MESNPYNPSQSETNNQEKSGKPLVVKVIRWCLFIGGGLFLVLVVLFGWAAFTASKTYTEFDGVAKPFIQSFLGKQNPWSYDKVKPYLSELWLSSVEKEKSKKLFKYYNKLGRLGSIVSTEWRQCSTMSHTSIGTVDRCDYLTVAEYENGTAHISVGLVYEGESPKIVQMHVDSEAFLEQ